MTTCSILGIFGHCQAILMTEFYYNSTYRITIFTPVDIKATCSITKESYEARTHLSCPQEHDLRAVTAPMM